MPNQTCSVILKEEVAQNEACLIYIHGKVSPNEGKVGSDEERVDPDEESVSLIKRQVGAIKTQVRLVNVQYCTTKSPTS